MLAFKSGISSQFTDALPSWNQTSPSPCNWEGVSCNRFGWRVIGLILSSSGLVGSISPHIGNLSFLRSLQLQNNEIPDEIGQLENLQELNLAGNRISGAIPDSIANLQNLNLIDLSRNQLVGGIPSSFGNFSSIASMDLSNNRLNGSIPREVLSLRSLSIILNLANNFFSGGLNQDVGLLQNVVSIDLSSNLLSGSIPDEIRNCTSLERLAMARNIFSGSIPGSLGEIKGLEVLDLSYNQLSGIIPPEILSLQALQTFNISFNNLEVNPCRGAHANFSRVQFEGNPKLPLSLSCQNGRSNRLVTVLIISAVATTAALFFSIGSFYYMRKKNRQKVTHASGLLKETHQMVSYDELRRATDNFGRENLVGDGGFGSVYRGKLADDTAVAIKVLNVGKTGSWSSFLAECKALRNVKHRNLVKLITTCSSVDHKNEDFWALVYEFLPNGSLADRLQPGINRDGFNLLRRLNIAIDVASILDYLHHDCEVPVVHCDLKPSNILLDQDMTAKVGDFGLAKLLIEKMGDQSSISSLHGLMGSIGYIPPGKKI
ncbi:unnamed protein product [Linum tenue]|uniref:non-specific serine/threonine protein kinase n=1 Tax=Linum tenue TaxID=586396 RepID=A0AAV0QHB0_9ROSI|nr:unnamed protein product [Linum tenue]